MKQEQQYFSEYHPLQRQSRTPAPGQHIFWGVFWGALWWLLFGLVLFLAMLASFGWHIPLLLSFAPLFASYIALMIVAIRQYQRFRRKASPSSPPDGQQGFREGQIHPAGRERPSFADPQPFSPDDEQFQVPYPEA